MFNKENLTEDQKLARKLRLQGKSRREVAVELWAVSSRESTLRSWESKGLLDEEGGETEDVTSQKPTTQLVMSEEARELEVIKLHKAGVKSREIALKLWGRKTAKSSVNDIIAEYKSKSTILDTTLLYSIVTTNKVKEGCTQLMIPDTQCKPDIDMSYLSWIGEYIAHKKPEVIVHIGDHFDMPSLSIYDKGKRTAEGKRVYKDIQSGIEGMNLLLKPLYELQQRELREFGRIKYKPKMVFTLGNHEERLSRHVDSHPELHGFLSYDNFKLKEFGWEVYDFLKPATINGISYVHYMANPMTGKPYGGTALNVLKNVGESFCMGHKQCLDVATRYLPASGRQQWAVICGASYPHMEGYKGPQGNFHFRGVVMKHQCKDGAFNLMTVDLEYLESRYG